MAPAEASQAETNEWKYLTCELWNRTREPFCSVSSVVFTIVAVILFGGLGIWVEVIKLVLMHCEADLGGVTTAVLTFFPALIGTTSIQLVLDSYNKKDKTFIAFALFMFCIFVGIAIALPPFATVAPQLVLTCGGCASALAVWFWWVANSRDDTFQRTPRVDASAGGDPSRRPAGSLAGYTA